MTFNTPVLLLAWRRPHTTQQVINAIRAVKPTRMFVACDGPNPKRPGEAAKVMVTREVIEREIDWPCTIERHYSEVNQGCKLGVSRAISSFLSNATHPRAREVFRLQLSSFSPLTWIDLFR